MPSFFEIGPPVREKKIFEGFLPYMSMAAILVGQAVSEKKIFEDDDDGQTPGASLSYKLTCEPSAQVS